jgi:hypothetical protein
MNVSYMLLLTINSRTLFLALSDTWQHLMNNRATLLIIYRLAPYHHPFEYFHLRILSNAQTVIVGFNTYNYFLFVFPCQINSVH